MLCYRHMFYKKIYITERKNQRKGGETIEGEKGVCPFFHMV